MNKVKFIKDNNIIDGKAYANYLKSIIKEKTILTSRTFNKKPPKLAIIQVKGDKASNIYVKNKIKSCHEVGFKVIHYIIDPKELNQGMWQDLAYEISKYIQLANNDDSVNGII